MNKFGSIHFKMLKKELPAPETYYINRLWMRGITEHTTKEEFEAMKEDSDRMDQEFEDKSPEIWKRMLEAGIVTTGLNAIRINTV